jgi:hypothetical protein
MWKSAPNSASAGKEKTMSDLSAGGSGGPMESPAGAAGGTPAESDLPGLQGLDDSVADPDDPQSGDGSTAESEPTPLSVLSDDEGGAGTSDPAPDTSGAGS